MFLWVVYRVEQVAPAVRCVARDYPKPSKFCFESSRLYGYFVLLGLVVQDDLSFLNDGIYIHLPCVITKQHTPKRLFRGLEGTAGTVLERKNAFVFVVPNVISTQEVNGKRYWG